MFVSLGSVTNSMMPLYSMYRLSSHEPDACSVVKRLFQRSTTQLVVSMFFFSRRFQRPFIRGAKCDAKDRVLTGLNSDRYKEPFPNSYRNSAV
jgi:hypothetical protein